jgi:aspartate aminotransferase
VTADFGAHPERMLALIVKASEINNNRIGKSLRPTVSPMTQFDATKLLSRRATAVEEAAIIRMAQKARDLRAAGRDVVSLTIGEPDFDTPLQIQAAASDAMRQGFTHYAPVAGFPELRAAIARKLGSENGLDYGPNDIVLANGAKQAITNAVFALVEDGDEVILLAPYWIAYEGIVRMAGGKPIVLPSSIDNGFKTSAAQLEASIGPRTKLIFLNSPNNPSGAVHSRDELAALADVVRKHAQVMVIADEIYEHIAFDGPVVSIATLPGMRDRTVTINGFSKAYAMTGWRLGYGAAAEPVARAMAKIQGTFTAGANAFVQQAAIVALASGSEDVARMRDIYRRRREIVVTSLRSIPGVRVVEPAGTFYVFPDVSSYLGRRAGNHVIDTVDQLCDWLIDLHELATVPGTAFGNTACIRLSFAASEKDLERGLARLGAALRQLS